MHIQRVSRYGQHIYSTHPARDLTCRKASDGCDVLVNIVFNEYLLQLQVGAGGCVCLSTIMTILRGMQGMKERMSTLASSLGLGGQGNPLGLGQ